MKANKKFVEEDEAVSAVIGVILMVAITVAIAATVYVYISSLGTGTSTVPPAVKLSVTDGAATASGGPPAVFAEGAQVFVIEHSGGDKLTVADLKIQYKDQTTPDVTWQDCDVVSVPASSYDLDYVAITYLSVGDEISVTANGAATEDGDYIWRIIHIPSSAIILTEVVVEAI